MISPLLSGTALQTIKQVARCPVDICCPSVIMRGSPSALKSGTAWTLAEGHPIHLCTAGGPYIPAFLTSRGLLYQVGLITQSLSQLGSAIQNNREDIFPHLELKFFWPDMVTMLSSTALFFLYVTRSGVTSQLLPYTTGIQPGTKKMLDCHTFLLLWTSVQQQTDCPHPDPQGFAIPAA